MNLKPIFTVTLLTALLIRVSPGVAAEGTAGGIGHPPVPFLDATGARVIDSGAPVSTMTTCGTCHDTQYIADHSYHVSLGTQAERANRFDAVTYDGGDPAQLGTAELSAWIRQFGHRHVGGGFATGTQMNCFLCHLASPAVADRQQVLESGAFAEAPMATLAGTGLVTRTASDWRWNLDAFDTKGAPPPGQLGLQTPDAENCGLCHGAVVMDHEQPFFLAPSAQYAETMTTGTIFAPGRIRRSGMNVADKDQLSRPWDVHAERLLDCVSCHGSSNSPALYSESTATRPGHLHSEARRLDISQFLRTPSHDFVKGNVSQAQIGGSAAGTMQTCQDCHEATTSHDFLPYSRRHFESLQCEACHIPMVHGAALESANWTMLDTDGQGLFTYRGVDGDPADARSLVSGYQPVLLPRRDPGKAPQLAPQNLVSVFYWFDEARGERVPLAILRAALLEGSRYRPRIMAALDIDGSDCLEDVELHLAEPDAVEAVRAALMDAGATRPVIRGQLNSYGVHHGVAPGKMAIRDCQVCHGGEARFSAAVSLAAYLPGGVQPTTLNGTNVALAGIVEVTDEGGLAYRADPSLAGMSPLGFEPHRWVDRIGLWLGVMTLCGVLIHGGTRVFVHLNTQAGAQRPAPQANSPSQKATP